MQRRSWRRQCGNDEPPQGGNNNTKLQQTTTERLRLVFRRVGPESRGPVLHERDVLRNPGAPELHEIRAARYGVLEMAVEARRMRAPDFRSA